MCEIERIHNGRHALVPPPLSLSLSCPLSTEGRGYIHHSREKRKKKARLASHRTHPAAEAAEEVAEVHLRRNGGCRDGEERENRVSGEA